MRLTQELAVQGGLMLMDLLAEEPGRAGHLALRKALGLGAQYGVLLPYGRTHESEADLMGLELMARAGSDPRASLELWRNMAAAGDGQPLEFLSTHPSQGSRLEDLEAGMDTALALQRKALAEGERPSCILWSFARPLRAQWQAQAHGPSPQHIPPAQLRRDPGLHRTRIGWLERGRQSFSWNAAPARRPPAH